MLENKLYFNNNQKDQNQIQQNKIKKQMYFEQLNKNLNKHVNMMQIV